MCVCVCVCLCVGGWVCAWGGSKNVSVGPCNPNDAFLLKFHKTKIEGHP